MKSVFDAKIRLYPMTIAAAVMGSVLFELWLYYAEPDLKKNVFWLSVLASIGIAFGVAGAIEKIRQRPFLVPVWIPVILIGVPAVTRMVLELIGPGKDWLGIALSIALLVCVGACVAAAVLRKDPLERTDREAGGPGNIKMF